MSALFTTPNGAVVDADKGTIVTPAPSTPTATAQSTAVNDAAPTTPAVPTQTPEQAANTQSATGQAPAPATQGQTTPQTQPATAPVTPTTPQANAGSTGTVPTYSGPSVTDYLASKGQPSDFNSRSALATQHGINNYTGSEAQNTQLLNELKGAQGGTSSSGITTPTGTVGSSGTLGASSTDTSTSGKSDPYAGLDPIQKQVKMYTDAYQSLGLNTIKTQYDDFTKQYNDLTTELADKIGEKNNNPWLSSTSRSEEITKIQDRYDGKLKTLSNLLTLTDSMYKQGQAQVDHLVSDANADIKATNDLAQKQIDAANALAKDNQVVSVGGRELLVNKDTGKTVADLGPATKTGSASADTLDAASGSITGDVKDILEGRNTLFNIRQTMGRSNSAAAYMQEVRSQVRSQDPNFDFVASDAGGKSVSSAYVQRATAAINSVLPNIEKITQLSDQVSRVGVTGVDKLLQKGGLILNNQKVANFHQAQKLIADEIGVALGAGAVSDMKLQLGFDVTDPSVSQEVFASNMKVVKEFLENRRSGLQSLRYSSSTANGVNGSSGGGQTNPSTPNAQTDTRNPLGI